MNKAQRLAVAGLVAPVVRESAASNQARRVALVDADGNVTGYTTLAEVQRQILERAQIEFEVQPDKRPERSVCVKCGAVFRQKPGGLAKQCEGCRRGTCLDCHAQLPVQSNANKRRRKRCGACSIAHRKAARLDKVKRWCCTDCGAPTSSSNTKRCRSCYEKSTGHRACSKCGAVLRGASTRALGICRWCATDTHCRRGHERAKYGVIYSGVRQCKACNAENMRARRAVQSESEGKGGP